MPKGAGFQGAGLSPAGFGAPDRAPITSVVPLPDPQTGLSLTGRAINFKVGDYIFTADGRIQGMGTIAQLVELAITTRRGSGAITDLGQALTQIAVKGPNYKRQVATLLTQAVAHLIRAKLIAIVSIDVDEPTGLPDTSIATMKWRDLTAPIPNQTTGSGGVAPMENTITVPAP